MIIYADQTQSFTGSIVIAKGCQTASPVSISSTVLNNQAVKAIYIATGTYV